MTQIASGYTHGPNAAAFVVGPAGLAYNAATDTLYVAAEGDDAIYKISNASTATDSGTGTLVVQDQTHLHGPLGLLLLPNGNLLTANSDGVNADPNQPSELVEYTTTGGFVSQFSVDPANGGAFGLGITSINGQLRFAAVDDNTNTISVWFVFPRVTSVSPATGPTTGNTTVTITARTCWGPRRSILARFRQPASRSTATRRSPLSRRWKPRRVDITVATNGGSPSTPSPVDQFTYLTPAADGLPFSDSFNTSGLRSAAWINQVGVFTVNAATGTATGTPA